ncbi:hypothetical protein DM860_011739 [Cuscuta australis]|uniref:Pectinesterase inhibitor domain-containing protein n=1 Tax=Cuscuta australis TaxID=267555 RepID=A0A328DEY5_9ASTE|nr:hypothetical protein DM860_011739 [Cuscuta australis]
MWRCTGSDVALSLCGGLIAWRAADKSKAAMGLYSFPLALILLFTCYCLSAADWSAADSLSSTPEKRPSYASLLNFVQSTCGIRDINQTLCYESLAPHAILIKGSPRRAAQFVLSICQSEARSTRDDILGKIMAKRASKTLSKRENVALGDCHELMSDLCNSLKPTAKELAAANTGNQEQFLKHIGNVQTWLSAAITDPDTCLDGLDGETKVEMEERVSKVTQLTTVALALVNKFGERVQKKLSIKDHQLYYNYNNLP